MPKLAIHSIIMDEAANDLRASQIATDRQAGAEINNNRSMSILGSIGPDLFFWSPEYKLIDKIYKFYQNYQKLIDIYNQILEPIRRIHEAVVEPVEEAVEAIVPNASRVIGTLLEEIKETAGLFRAAVGTGLFAGVIDGVNLITDTAGFPSLAALFFDNFKPDLQSNKKENEWYWFDVLHYRKTGEFAKNLMQNSNGAQTRAYTYGYFSHIATDLVGHAFVNQLVNGPYRMHVQRHVTAENFMDAWKFLNYYGNSINQSLEDRMSLPEALPEGVRNLLDKSFKDTYREGEYPNFLTTGDIDQTYDTFYKVLKIMKNMYVPRPEEPFEGVMDILTDALGDMLQPPPSPPSTGEMCEWGDILSFGFTESSRECYSEAFENLEDWARYVGNFLVWTVEAMMDLVDLLLTVFLALPVIVLLAILYGLQLMLYNLYQSTRSFLALQGFVYPEPEDLNSSYGGFLTRIYQCPISPFKYPLMGDLSMSHLSCPINKYELPTTAADFNSRGQNVTADLFTKDLPFNIDNLKQYAKAINPAKTREIEGRHLRIGNAIDLTNWMISTAANPNSNQGDKNVLYTNWNLDSDRGYGYKTWKGKVPQVANEDVKNEEYL